MVSVVLRADAIPRATVSSALALLSELAAFQPTPTPTPTSNPTPNPDPDPTTNHSTSPYPKEELAAFQGWRDYISLHLPISPYISLGARRLPRVARRRRAGLAECP